MKVFLLGGGGVPISCKGCKGKTPPFYQSFFFRKTSFFEVKEEFLLDPTRGLQRACFALTALTKL